jgi:hypothetical protein
MSLRSASHDVQQVTTSKIYTRFCTKELNTVFILTSLLQYFFIVSRQLYPSTQKKYFRVHLYQDSVFVFQHGNGNGSRNRVTCETNKQKTGTMEASKMSVRVNRSGFWSGKWMLFGSRLLHETTTMRQLGGTERDRTRVFSEDSHNKYADLLFK